MPGPGFTASGEQLADAQSAIQQAVSNVEQLASDFTSAVGEPGFGKAHSQYYANYAKSFENVGKSLDDFTRVAQELAGGIGAAGAMYDDADSNASGAVNEAGGNV